MLRTFKFDYDYDNDSLFLFDPKSKTKASIEVGDLIIDYSGKKEISGIELMHASDFLNDIGNNEVSKDLLKEMLDCKIDIISKNNFFIIKFILSFKSNKQLSTPIIIPTINELSPALASA